MIVVDLSTIEGAEVQSRQVSLAPSSVTISVPAARYESPYPWRHGDVIRLLRDGNVLIEGPMAPAPKWTLRGDAWYWAVTIHDYWYWMDSTPYLGSRPDMIQPGAGRPGDNPDLLQIRYAFCQAAKSADQESGVRMTLLDLLSSAKRAGIFPVDLDVRVAAAETIPFICSSATYASVCRQIHDWVPNAAAWFDYSAIEEEMRVGMGVSGGIAVPKFIIAEPDSLPVVDVLLSDIETTSLVVQARPDLVPPVVGIVGTDTDDVGNFIVVNSVRPLGARLSQPGAVVLAIDAGTVAEAIDAEPSEPEEPEDPDNPKPDRRYKYTNEPIMRIKGATIPADGSLAAAFWRRHVPELDIPGLLFGSQLVSSAPLTGQEGKGYSAEATKYELVEGQIGNKSPGVKWGKVIIKQAIAYPGVGVPKDKEALFPNIRTNGQRWGWHSLELITTNVRAHQYRVGGNYDSKPIDPAEEEEEEDDPPAAGNITPVQRGRYDRIVESYYQATRHLPYDLQCTLCLFRHDLRPGVMLNIIGANPEWSNMLSILQGVDVDYSTGRMSITAGPAKHLSLDKAMAATKRITQQVEDTKLETTPDPEGTRTTRWDTKSERKKKAPESPGVGPSSKYIPPSGGSQDQGDFCVRVITDESGSKSYQVHSGKFQGLATGGYYGCGDAEWTPWGEGDVWANLEVNNGGTPVRSSFTRFPGRQEAWSPVWKNDNISDGIDMSKTKPGFYSFKVATIADGAITQHVASPIPIAYNLTTFAF